MHNRKRAGVKNPKAIRESVMITYDVIIIGGGPVGLIFAKSLAKTGLSVAVIEQQSESTLVNPSIDGRDIALTHYSHRVLQELEIWDHVPANEVSAIREARVINGHSSYYLHFNTLNASQDKLAYLVSNHLLRKAAYNAIKSFSTIDLYTETQIEQCSSNDSYTTVLLSSGKTLKASLLVAADGRLSKTRCRMGISASLQDFAKTIIVCRMRHELPHYNIAYECFQYAKTLAVLPLNHSTSSIVMTVPSHQANDIMHMREQEFNKYIPNCFENRLGAMELCGERYSYPLVTVYANQFTKGRYALIGDAAVGMHPVTAHGFNFGLKGLCTLSSEIQKAKDKGDDIGSSYVLKRYQHIHRLTTSPLYHITNIIAKIYTNDHQIAKLGRHILLRTADRMIPIKNTIINRLIKNAA